MKKLTFLLLLFSTVLLISTSCRDKNELPDPENPNEYVNNWIYKQMSTYYYWNDKIPAKPDYTATSPDFFKSLVYKFDVKSNPDGDRFSWIQESYVDLLNALSGISSDEIGFEYVPVPVGPDNIASKRKYYLLVLYPKLNTDAYAKGIKRGNFITKINNQSIIGNNLSSLISKSGDKELTLAELVYNEETKQYDFKPLPHTITVKTHKNFAESPIYLDSVYTINNKKIGYLVYNFFARDKGDGAYTYDKILMSTLGKIKSKGATEFVLDLRYNGGGAVSSAIALASALVKNRSTQNLLITTEHNPIVTASLKKQYGEEYNKDYFIDNIVKISYDNNGNETGRSDIATVPTLNLPRLYVLASRWTASASELIINGLKPYMDVVIIGETTVGKNVGSFTLYEKNDPKNKWGMQPITFKYFNGAGKSDFSSGFKPDYEVNILENMVDFGKTEDPYLNKALSLISGTEITPTARMTKTGAELELKVVESSASMKITEMYDDRYQGSIKK